MTPKGALLGQLIDGRYRVDDVLGEGGFGTVYAAFHVGLRARVALKVPRVDDLGPAAAAEAVATFLEEGRTLKRLRHPNIVAALDVGLLPPRADGLALPYLVLEWCDGPTLKEWLAEHRASRSIDEAWSILRPVVDAIAHAHAEGVVHRDIKPANVILERARDGRLVPRVIDFGIAKLVATRSDDAAGDARTTSQRSALTPKYAAPEQLTGLRTGPSTDVYALALVWMEVVLGRPVFASDDEARRATAESEAPSARGLGLALDEAWRVVVDGALARRPADRFADAGLLLRAADGVTGWTSGRERASTPGGGAPHPARERDGPADPPDDSVMPSSRTARTLTPSATTTPPGRAASGRRRAALGVSGLAAFGVIATLAWRHGTTTADPGAPDLAASASATIAVDGSARPPFSAEPAGAPLRALGSLTGGELVERASAAGVAGCHAIEVPGLVSVSCPRGQLTLRDLQLSGAAPADLLPNLRHEARSFARIYGAARFTTDGTWGLIASASDAHADELVRRVLAGVRHEAIGTDGPLPARAIPARLAAWRGADVAARIPAVGGEVTWETSKGTPMVHFLVGTEPGSTMLVEGDPEAWLAQMKDNPTPFSYAVDGDRLLACFGTGSTGELPFLRAVLGPARATRLGRIP